MKVTIHTLDMKDIVRNIGIFTLVIALTSCNDWLDVKPDTEEREKDLFTSYQGFKDALSGCYTLMAKRSAYGEALTMNSTECLACLWAEPDESTQPTEHFLYAHEYQNDQVRQQLSSTYQALFTVIAGANKIISHIESADSSVIRSPQARWVIRAEAYAIRAFCQFDILRLFGQMPSNPQQQVRLPYATKSSIGDLPHYYDYDRYVQMLFDDLGMAESLLRKADPAVGQTLESLNFQASTTTDEDDFLTFRQMRMNYWAVQALKARIYLYTGQTSLAHDTALGVITGGNTGVAPVGLSGPTDVNLGYFALPGECLFILSNPDMINYSITLLGGDATAQIDEYSQLHITTDMLNLQLYAGQNTTSNNRYLRIWERSTANATGRQFPTIKKYYYDTRQSNSLTTLRSSLQILPLLRLSEMYLIVLETTDDLAEANSLYKTYMASHNVRVTDDFASLTDVRNEVVGEYRREFYGEGVMFFTYKRLGMADILWCNHPMTEQQYILPLPVSEYDPDE